MTRTYYIRFPNGFGEEMWDKIKYTSTEDRPRFHKVEALNSWKAKHPGYGAMVCKVTSSPVKNGSSGWQPTNRQPPGGLPRPPPKKG